MFRRFLGLFDGSKPEDPRVHFVSEVEAVLRSLPAVRDIAPVDGTFALDATTKTGVKHRVCLDNLVRRNAGEYRCAILRVLLGNLNVPFSPIEFDLKSRLAAICGIVRPSTEVGGGSFSAARRLRRCKRIAIHLVDRQRATYR
jgi:hypothetical protein